MVVDPTEEDEERLGTLVQDLTVYFCADDGLVAFPKPEKFQSLFEVLVDLFNWVVFQNNVRKMESIAFRPCYTPGGMSKDVYTRWSTGFGPSYHDRLRLRV